MRRLPLQNPSPRFAKSVIEYDGPETQGLEIYEDGTRSVLSRNDSPDLPFRWSVNPYRGCVHGCAYCYARPTHEYLGWGAGSDFERRIVIKRQAPALLREALASPRWKGEPVLLSGATDAYQPIEASLGLTRGCLEALADAHNPTLVVTKGTTVERDIDVLARLARGPGVRVTISVPLWDEEHARAIEPLAPAPARRIETIARLARAGIPVGVNVAPLIPGLGDAQMPHVLEAARDAGARWAAWILVRLPGNVVPVFEERLRASLPTRADKILSRLREAHGGNLYNAHFSARMRGAGPYASAIETLFQRTTTRLNLSPSWSLTSQPRQLPLF